jgi:prevent-host-death family protein
MKSVNTHEAKTQLSRLLQRVAAGEEIAIANRGVPVARLVPIAAAEKRKLGAFTGQIRMKEHFDAPLPEDVLATFEGKRKRVKTKE